MREHAVATPALVFEAELVGVRGRHHEPARRREERLKAPGEYVEDHPILKIAEIDPLMVEVILPVSQFGSIHTGMTADILPEIDENHPYPATVTLVDRVVDAASGTFGVRLELPNSEHQLPGGLRCKVRFQSEKSPRG